MREPYTPRHRQPLRQFKLIFRKASLQMTAGSLLLHHVRARTIVGLQVDRLVIALAESIDSESRIVLPVHRVQSDLCTRVGGIQMLYRADGCVVRIAIVVRSMEVYAGRDCETHVWRQRAQPG